MRPKESAGHFGKECVEFDHKEPADVHGPNSRLSAWVFSQSTQPSTHLVFVTRSFSIPSCKIPTDLLLFFFQKVPPRLRSGFFVRKTRPDYNIGHKIHKFSFEGSQSHWRSSQGFGWGFGWRLRGRLEESGWDEGCDRPIVSDRVTPVPPPFRGCRLAITGMCLLQSNSMDLERTL